MNFRIREVSVCHAEIEQDRLEQARGPEEDSAIVQDIMRPVLRVLDQAWAGVGVGASVLAEARAGVSGPDLVRDSGVWPGVGVLVSTRTALRLNRKNRSSSVKPKS